MEAGKFVKLVRAEAAKIGRTMKSAERGEIPLGVALANANAAVVTLDYLLKTAIEGGITSEVDPAGEGPGSMSDGKDHPAGNARTGKRSRHTPVVPDRDAAPPA